LHLPVATALGRFPQRPRAFDRHGNATPSRRRLKFKTTIAI